MGEIGLMSLLSNALSVGHKEEVTVHELIDTATSYAKGEVPELVVLLSKEEMAEYNKSSYIEKVVLVTELVYLTNLHLFLLC